MKKIALAAALATSFVAPAFADGHTSSFAVMHFNMDQDSSGNRVMSPSGMNSKVELSPGSTLADVFGHLNMDADNQMGVAGQGVGGVTIITGDQGAAAEIFRRLMRESAEDE